MEKDHTTEMKKLKYIYFAMLAMFTLLFYFVSSKLVAGANKNTPDVVR